MIKEYWDRIETALGTLTIAVDDRGCVTNLIFGAGAIDGEHSSNRWLAWSVDKD